MTAGRAMKTSALALRVTLYFARNPDEELTSADVASKFGLIDGDVHMRLSRPVKHGLLARSGGGPGRGRLAVYSAGPQLLAMIGQAAPAPEPDDEATPSAAVAMMITNTQPANVPQGG